MNCENTVKNKSKYDASNKKEINVVAEKPEQKAHTVGSICINIQQQSNLVFEYEANRVVPILGK
jgi:hypothetical protein